MTEVSDRIRAIFAEQAMLDLADVTPEARLSDLGVDSLALVEAIFAIEEAFDVSVPFNANEPERTVFDISTVGSVVAAVEGLIARKAA
jgi:acyl carrier protein